MQVKVCSLGIPQHRTWDWRNHVILTGNLQPKPDRLFQKEQQDPRHDMPLLSTNPTADLCLLFTSLPKCTLMQATGSLLIIVGSTVAVPAVLALAWEQGLPCVHLDSSSLESRKQPPSKAQKLLELTTTTTASCFIGMICCITPKFLQPVLKAHPTAV